MNLAEQPPLSCAGMTPPWLHRGSTGPFSTLPPRRQCGGVSPRSKGAGSWGTCTSIRIQTSLVALAPVVAALVCTASLAADFYDPSADRRITSRKTDTSSAMPPYNSTLQPGYAADLTAFLLAQKKDIRSQGPVAPRRTPEFQRPGTTPGIQQGAGFSVEQRDGRLAIAHSGRPVAEFVFRDELILRPCFANLHAPGGIKVTRNHPPVVGIDATDHDTMHPGLWLAFGDISGTDFWRNKGRIEHVRFTEPPVVQERRVAFATECRLLTEDGRALCSLTNRFTLSAKSGAWLLVWDSTFRSETGEILFGDQEEMGFGARVATSITEKNGGLITSSAGLKSAKDTWGQPAEWCDYSGTVGEHHIGITLMTDPGNRRPSWWHNRDYGVFVANPFGRAAMKQGPKSAVVVRRGESLRLRFGAAIHAAPAAAPPDPAVAYRDFLHEIRTGRE